MEALQKGLMSSYVSLMTLDWMDTTSYMEVNINYYDGLCWYLVINGGYVLMVYRIP